MKRATWLHFCRGANQPHNIAILSDGGTLEGAQEFAALLATYSDTPITYVSISQGDDTQIGQLRDGAYSSVGFHAQIEMRQAANGKLCFINLFSPSDTIFDDEKRVLPAVGNAISSAYSTYTGKLYTFVRGGICGKALGD